MWDKGTCYAEMDQCQVPTTKMTGQKIQLLSVRIVWICIRGKQADKKKWLLLNKAWWCNLCHTFDDSGIHTHCDFAQTVKNCILADCLNVLFANPLIAYASSSACSFPPYLLLLLVCVLKILQIHGQHALVTSYQNTHHGCRSPFP